MASWFAFALVACFFLHAASSFAAAPYCLPGQSCFPSAAELDAFNQSISGRLFHPPPYGQVCYQGHWDQAACSKLVQNRMVAEFRETIPAGMMFLNNEFDENGNGCIVPQKVPPSPLNGSCVLGALGTYFVNVSSAQDISTSIQFAAKYNLRLRVKNTGHDYTGRSTGPGAFIIWTKNLQTVDILENFTATGCAHDSSVGDVFALGAGVVVEQLYNATEQAGKVTVGGFGATVGVAGGFSLGGGAAGPFQPLFGIGADNIVQYDIVTVDGTITVANACQNPNLFWAMRGGGGAFAITTKTYIKAYPAFAAVNAVVGTITATSNASYNQMIQTFIENDPEIMENFTSGLYEATFPNLTLAFQKAFQDHSSVVSANASFATFNFLRSIPGLEWNVSALQFPSWNQAYTKLVGPCVDAGDIVGVDLLLSSRIISTELLGTAAGRASMANFVTSLPHGKPLIVQRVGGGAVNQVAADATPVNPAWRSSLGYIDISVVDLSNLSATNGPVDAYQNQTLDALVNTANGIFGTAAYYNEDNRREADHENRFWGSNYGRLLQIKQEVDPTGILSSTEYVGSEIFGT